MARPRLLLGLSGERDTPVKTSMTRFQFFSPTDRDNGVMTEWITSNEATGDRWIRADFDDGVCFAHFGEECTLTNDEISNVIFYRKMLELPNAPKSSPTDKCTIAPVKTEQGVITPEQSNVNNPSAKAIRYISGVIALAKHREEANVGTRGTKKVFEEVIADANYFGPRRFLDETKPVLGYHLVGSKIQVGWNYIDKTKSNNITTIWCNGTIRSMSPTRESKRHYSGLSGKRTIKKERDATRFWDAEVLFDARVLKSATLNKQDKIEEEETTWPMLLDIENWSTSRIAKHLRWRLLKE